MRAITLRPPWGSLVAAGLKTIETRTHGRFAGLVGQRVAIHQGLPSVGWPSWMANQLAFAHHLGTFGVKFAYEAVEKNDFEQCRHIANWGRVICTAHVMAMIAPDHKLASGEPRSAAESTLRNGALCETAGLWCYRLIDIQPVPPDWPGCVAKGRQGIWEIEMEDPWKKKGNRP